MTVAHITAHGDKLTATFPWGAAVTGTLDEVTEALHVAAIKGDDITMPDKNAADSPSNGQRIAIYAALKKIVWIGEYQMIDRADYASARELFGQVSAEQLGRWVDDGALFALDHGGIALYPRYGLTSGPQSAPRPLLREIIAALEMDPWHVAMWFAAGCGMLDGRRPMDVLSVDAEAVLVAAKDQAMGITHG